MRQRLFIIFVEICLLGSSLLGACTGNANKQPILPCVKLTYPVRVKDRTVKCFSGIIKEMQDIQLAFRTSGQIEKVNVKKGDYVRKGDLIARLDSKDYQLEVRGLQAQYDQMQREVERMRQLYTDKSLSGNDFEKAEATLEELKTRLQISKNRLSYTTLEAPVNGYVQDVLYEQTEMVNSGSVVANLINIEHMEVECDIPASLYLKRDAFSDFSCRTNLAAKEYPLQLISILPKADNNQLYKMCLLLSAQKQAELTAGMNVTLNIGLSEKQNKGTTQLFNLPIKSIFTEEGKSYLWIMDTDSVIHRREITFHSIDSDGQAVVSGILSENDAVIKAGVNALHDKDKVRIIREAEKTNIGEII